MALSNLPNELAGSPPAVHALAARKIIQDFEDGRYDEQVKRDDPAVDVRRLVKAHIVRLGKTYAISSTHTSFVAVDETTPPQQRVHVAPRPMLFGASSFAQPRPQQQQQQQQRQPMMFGSAPRAPMLQAYPTGYMPPPPLPRPMFGAPPPPPGRVALNQSFGGGLFGAASPSSYLSFGSTGSAPPKTWSTPNAASSSFGGGDLLGASFAAPALMPCSVDLQTMEQYKEELQYASTAPLPDEDDCFGDLEEEEVAPPPPAEQLEALARRQAFDGSFSMDVLRVVNPALKAADARAAFEDDGGGLDDKVIATVLAMAFISGKIGGGDDKAAWEGMYEKAESYLEEVLGGGGVGGKLDELFVKVVDLIV